MNTKAPESKRKAKYRKRVHGAVEPMDAKHPRYKWVVPFWQGGRRLKRYFNELAEANTFAKQQNVKLENLGRRIENITGAELEDAIAARREVEGMGFAAVMDAVRELKQAREIVADCGVSVLDAAKEVAARLRAEAASQVVAVAVDECVASKRANGASKDYLRDLESRLGLFKKRFGERPLCNIKGAEVEAWLNSQEWAPASVGLMRRNLSVLWSFGKRRGWVTENTILERTEAPKVRLAVPSILKPEAWKKVLKAAEEVAQRRNELGFLWWVVLGGFQGCRPREAERVSWDNVRENMGDLELSAAITKTAGRRLVPLLPAFKAFLERYRPADATGLMVNLSAQQLRDRREEACKAAGVEWSPDILRHSWCSYRVAEVGDAGKVAYEAGHSVAVQNKHYRELVHATEAQAWFGVRPQLPEGDGATGNVIPFKAA
jgi:integrase